MCKSWNLYSKQQKRLFRPNGLGHCPDLWDIITGFWGRAVQATVPLLKTEHSTVLIDAGFSGKRICEMLEDAGQRIEDVDAVFVTHEHSDHATGLKGLARHGHLKFFANEDTARPIQKQLSRRVNWKLFKTGQSFVF